MSQAIDLDLPSASSVIRASRLTVYEVTANDLGPDGVVVVDWLMRTR
jgi:hypothetical protein